MDAVTGEDAPDRFGWVVALVMMALADVLTRLVVIYLRGRRLAAGPAGPPPARPARARPRPPPRRGSCLDDGTAGRGVALARNRPPGEPAPRTSSTRRVGRSAAGSSLRTR